MIMISAGWQCLAAAFGRSNDALTECRPIGGARRDGLRPILPVLHALTKSRPMRNHLGRMGPPRRIKTGLRECRPAVHNGCIGLTSFHVCVFSVLQFVGDNTMPIGESKVLFQGRRFRVERQVQVGPDGRERIWDFVRHLGAAVILPLLDDGRLCLVRNARPAVGQTLIELPAGTLEPGEDPGRNRTARIGRGNRLSCRPDRAPDLVLFLARHLQRAHAPLPGPGPDGRSDVARPGRRTGAAIVLLGQGARHDP